MQGNSTRFLIALVGLTAVSAFGQDAFDRDFESPGLFHHHHIRLSQASGLSPLVSTPTGITPQQMRTVYGFNLVANQGQGQIVALVDAFDDPNIEADLGVFSTQFKLPACTTANGCFKKIYASGKKPIKSASWAGEISLDVEWAHAMAPQAKIYLVEAASASVTNLLKAVDVAVQSGATVVSMSWGGAETSTEMANDSHFTAPGVVFVASAGDSGYMASYPAASPYVVGVGGTSLTYSPSGVWESEAVWNNQYGATGGAVSVYESEPSWQTAFQNQGKRGIPDVAYDADPASGVPVYDSVPFQGVSGWGQFGGTSAGAPQIAAMIALVKSTRAAAGKSAISFPSALYSFTAGYHDITSGTNGTCGSLCDATGGYDFTTGIGTPIANSLIPALTR